MKVRQVCDHRELGETSRSTRDVISIIKELRDSNDKEKDQTNVRWSRDSLRRGISV